MVDYPYEANFLAPLPAYPVNVSCQIILGESDRLSGLAQAAGKIYYVQGHIMIWMKETEEFGDPSLML